MAVTTSHNRPPLKIWGGIESTINRVGDRFFDQCKRNGHHERVDDFKKIRALGITHLRYPFLWEDSNWIRFDRQIEEMRRVGIEPIAGLIHHGSGPMHTDLLDPEFPEKLAQYAATFAKRYPWIRDYTPINEPLTTARFSGLYGVWYPHHKCNRSFLKMLYHEIKATILAMKEIRKVNPMARLIQTEDLGKATGTQSIQYQVEFENERRWLSMDMLTGKIGPRHKLYSFLIDEGMTAEELDWLQKNACPPDLFGINHYLLSNRFLDEELHHHDPQFHGGNEKDIYADVGAVDTARAESTQAHVILKEAWDRFHIPIVVTEVHAAGPRETQLRWLKQMYLEAEKARSLGVNLEAITAWSLFGSFDWNSLCTQENGFYEPGVFDIRGDQIRPTALASIVKQLNDHTQTATFNDFELHPFLAQEGWWVKNVKRITTRPILVTGGRGTLAKAFGRICHQRGLSYRLVTREELDVTDPVQVKAILSELRPWAVINAAGYVKVDLAEQEREKCFRENVDGAEVLARTCAELKIEFLTFSSDLVFDGSSNLAYTEDAPVSALNTYGKSKAEAEKRLMKLDSKPLVIRTSSFFGPWDQANFLNLALNNIHTGKPFEAAHDLIMSPTYVPDLVNACLDLLIDRERGIIHLTNQGECSWADFAIQALRQTRYKSHLHLLVAKPADELNFVAARPKYSALASKRAPILPSLEDALERFFLESSWSNQTLKKGVVK